MPKKTEYCGRCAMSTVVDAVGDEEDGDEHNPFADERIELDERALARVSPGAWLSGIARRIDDLGQRLTYGRSR